jgi:hypothetical protein
MSRSILLPFPVLLLAGCASGSIAPGRLPEGATSGVYTVAEPQALASCIATALGSAAQPVADRIEIASVRQPGLRYSVGPNRDSLVYPTQVAVIGTESDPQETALVNACVNATVSG